MPPRSLRTARRPAGDRPHARVDRDAPGMGSPRSNAKGVIHKMPERPIPAFCSNCGTLFPSSVVGFDGAAETTLIGLVGGRIENLNIQGFSQTCPNCGQLAQVAEGHFANVTRGSLSIISAPELTHEMLRAYAKLLGMVLENKLPADALTKEAEKIHPKLVIAHPCGSARVRRIDSVVMRGIPLERRI